MKGVMYKCTPLSGVRIKQTGSELIGKVEWPNSKVPYTELKINIIRLKYESINFKYEVIFLAKASRKNNINRNTLSRHIKNNIDKVLSGFIWKEVTNA